MDTISNIRFDDWEAEQMQDPEFRAEVKALESVDEVMEQREALRQSILACWEVIAEAFIPAVRQVIDAIHTFMTQLQRVQLLTNLMRHWWIPDWLAHWLSDKWPERWLPELRFE